jgi:hypothetical protein
MPDLTPEERDFILRLLSLLTFNLDGLADAQLAVSIREKLIGVAVKGLG